MIDGSVMVSLESYAHEAYTDTQISREDNVPFPSHSVTSCVRTICGQAGIKGLVNITLVCGQQKLVPHVPQQEVVAPGLSHRR